MPHDMSGPAVIPRNDARNLLSQQHPRTHLPKNHKKISERYRTAMHFKPRISGPRLDMNDKFGGTLCC
ncbi:hypothetical protein J2X36_000048 [Methylobacterium sp. BE186]|nr:hypothetical protein [Methylobacterium sp. BE186]